MRWRVAVPSVLALLLSLSLLAGSAGRPVVGARAALPPDPVMTFARPDGALAAAPEDGMATVRLAGPGTGFVTSHAWSPDGQRVAFTRCRGRNCAQGSVFVVDADGSDERLVASPAGGATWMPDGSHLLVARAALPGYWVVAVGDGARRRFRAPGLDAAPFSPRLSPDGHWLLHLTAIYGRLIPNPYAPHHARARNWLLLTDLRTGSTRRVSAEPGLYFLGTTPWSPDGTRFTFTRRNYLQATGGRIYVGRPAGGPRPVADGAREAGAWSPDSLRLAFNVGNHCAIGVRPVDGTSPTRLLRFRGCLPTWRPTQ